MNKKKAGAILAAILLGLGLTACAGGSYDYQYYTAQELNDAMKSGASLLLLDVQPADQYELHHIPGAVFTDAFPGDTPESQAILKTYLKDVKQFDGDVVLICPMGKMGSVNAFDYFAAHGVDPHKLYILEGGQNGWPYACEGTGPLEG